ncbi:hypothetical protein C2R22_08655 [Salinigranum rubrum]|uniref:Uncharacterized protein n=1 Tax=Salinigranum rubrum TaxID=755307 RepID=A0A2I8VIG9_9EURY|nr:hypothetical protein [Salinigranum rubrum]AUV81710.1 hypothetical protein C2R22_08655 [Salinigranum rubrum]
MAHPPAPSVPSLDERGWERTDERREVRFELPTMRVLAHTLVYEDRALRMRVREATGVDHTWRFFFATRLAFDPPLPPLTGNASVYGTVRSEAREAFVDDLRARGVDRIERGRTDRTRTETGDRVSLTRYRGRYRLERAGVDVPVAGVLGVWTHDGDFRLAGGWYPDQSLAVTLSDAPETDPNAFRNELLDLVRGTR